MPRNRPIRVRRFIKVDGTHANGLDRKVWTNEFEQFPGPRELGHTSIGQKATTTSTRHRSKSSDQLASFLCWEDTHHQVETTLLNLLNHGLARG